MTTKLFVYFFVFCAVSAHAMPGDTTCKKLRSRPSANENLDEMKHQEGDPIIVEDIATKLAVGRTLLGLCRNQVKQSFRRNEQQSWLDIITTMQMSIEVMGDFIGTIRNLEALKGPSTNQLTNELIDAVVVHLRANDIAKAISCIWDTIETYKKSLDDPDDLNME